MNIFRASGDLLHLLSILILLFKIRRSKSCAGISLKTQLMYALVFTTRYLDIFHNLLMGQWYLFTMKLFFLVSSYWIVYLMLKPHKSTYDKEHDTLKVRYLLVPSLVLALVINQEFTPFEILWTFSLYLEAVAILPQLFLLQRTGEVEMITSDYIFTLGSYRALYLINWIYRYFTEDNYTQWIVWVSGIIQTGVYIDFFYYYIQSKRYGGKMRLPA